MKATFGPFIEPPHVIYFEVRDRDGRRVAWGKLPDDATINPGDSIVIETDGGILTLE